eukprot:Skav203892  [mRNA]  locus=scaffold1649:126886:138224:+ [translate_table: standard]
MLQLGSPHDIPLLVVLTQEGVEFQSKGIFHVVQTRRTCAIFLLDFFHTVIHLPFPGLFAVTLTVSLFWGLHEDAFCTSCSESGTKCFVGVFDGHGDQGKKMSHFAKQALSRSLFSNTDLHTEPVAAIQVPEHCWTEKIEKEHRHQAELSGTTAITAYQHRNHLVVRLNSVGEASASSAAPVGPLKDPAQMRRTSHSLHLISI